MPSRTRQQNVTAAQWSANGAALGSPDLTLPGNQVFGSNVFSPAVQRQRLPKHVYKALQRTLARGEALDTSLADAVAQAMKDWAMEKGATHYTHWFQPLTGSTAEKHDSFYGPAGDGTAIAEFSGKELIQGEPDASSLPHRRHPRDLRGARLHRLGPDLPGVHPREPQRRAARASRRRSRPGPARRSTTRSRCCARWTRSRARRSGRSSCSASTTPQRVFTTIGCEQEYFLIDEQYYFERPDLVTTGRTLFGAKPPKGHELDDHYFGSIPERILAYMLEVELELGKARRADQDAPQRGRAEPVRGRADLRELERRLRPPDADDADHAEHRPPLRPVCLLHEKPFAGVNGSGKHNNWSMGTDTGLNLLDPGDTPAENLQFLFFCAAVIQAVNTHQELLRASIASAGQDHRLGANEAPPAIISIFLGAELEKVFAAIEAGKVQASKPGSFLGLGTPVLPPLPLHGGDRNRTSPFAFTGNKFEFRALGSNSSPAWPNTVLNTIVAESVDELTDKLKAALKGAARRSRRRSRRVVKEVWTANKQIVFDGDGYSEAWHKEAEKRGLANLRRRPTRCRGSSRNRRSRPSRSTRCSPSASSRRAMRCSPSSTS